MRGSSSRAAQSYAGEVDVVDVKILPYVGEGTDEEEWLSLLVSTHSAFFTLLPFTLFLLLYYY